MKHCQKEAVFLLSGRYLSKECRFPFSILFSIHLNSGDFFFAEWWPGITGEKNVIDQISIPYWSSILRSALSSEYELVNVPLVNSFSLFVTFTSLRNKVRKSCAPRLLGIPKYIPYLRLPRLLVILALN
jgi:hypothetical protein